MSRDGAPTMTGGGTDHTSTYPRNTNNNQGSDGDSDELRELLQGGGGRDSFPGSGDEVDGLTSIIEPTLFDSSLDGRWDTHLLTNSSAHSSAHQQLQQQQRVQNHLYPPQLYNYQQHQQLLHASSAPLLSQHHPQPQPAAMTYPNMNSNDPFAALMSVSTAAAAMDTVGGMGDERATAAALAVGDFMKVSLNL